MRPTKTLLSFISFTAVAVVTLTAQRSPAMCGDVTGDGKISSSDALSVLREAVGDHHAMMCDMCGPNDTTTTTIGGGATTTTLAGGTTTTVPGSGLYTLRVATNGMMSGGMMDSGHGHVTSEPAGIDCGDDCTEQFDADQTVTLTAVADPDSDFVGRMGDVPLQCMYNDDPCTVTTTRDRDVWAVFIADHDGGGMGGGGMSR